MFYICFKVVIIPFKMPCFMTFVISIFSFNAWVPCVATLALPENLKGQSQTQA